MGEGDFGGEQEEEDLERVSATRSARRQEWGGVSPNIGQMGFRGDAEKREERYVVATRQRAAKDDAGALQSPSLMRPQMFAQGMRAEDRQDMQGSLFRGGRDTGFDRSDSPRGPSSPWPGRRTPRC